MLSASGYTTPPESGTRRIKLLLGPPMALKCYQSFLFSSHVAGFDLNPKVSLLPSLRRKTLGGGRVSTWTAACASSWTDLDKSVSTSTAHICANAGACGCARLARLWADTRARGRACARSHTPQITSGIERAVLDWPTEPSLKPRGRETLHGSFFSLFPLRVVPFNGKTTGEL